MRKFKRKFYVCVLSSALVVALMNGICIVSVATGVETSESKTEQTESEELPVDNEEPDENLTTEIEINESITTEELSSEETVFEESTMDEASTEESSTTDDTLEIDEVESLPESEQEESDAEDIISVALPSSFDLIIDPFSIETGDASVQVISDNYEIINYGTEDVVIEVKPLIICDGFEFVEDKPSADELLVSKDVEKARALYLAIQVADSGKEKDILKGKYSFDNIEYDQVMSKDNPDSFFLTLKGTNGDGEKTAESIAAFRFRGNVDPYGEYHDGDLKIQLTFNVVGVSDKKSKQLQSEEEKDKLNFIDIIE